MTNQIFQIKLKSFGVKFIKGEVVGFKKKIIKERDVTGGMARVMPDGSIVELEEIVQGVYVS